MRENWALATAALFACLYVALWFAFPSRNIHSDALDELLRVEAPSITLSAKHPAADMTVWAMMRGLRRLGYSGSAIRPVQVWNAVWMSAALLGVFILVVRNGGGAALALGTVLVLAGTHTALHLALDPFLLYWPPGLALTTWALLAAGGIRPKRAEQHLAVQGRSGRGCWCLVLLLLILTSLFNPMCIAAIPLASWFWLRRGQQVRSSLPQAVGLLVAGSILLTALVFLQHQSPRGGPFGVWTESSFSLALSALRNSLVSHAWGGPVGPTQVVTSICYLVMVPTLIVVVVCIASTRSRVFRFVPWFVASMVTGIFVLWWNPGQTHFWLLPVWFLVLGGSVAVGCPVSSSRAALPGRIDGLTRVLLLTLGLTLWVANGATYVVPALQPNRDADRARQIARQFSSQDELVSRVWPYGYIDYYTGMKTHGLLSIFMHRRDDQSTFGQLATIVEGVQRRGGSTFMEVPQEQEQWIPNEVHQRTDLDFSEEDFTAIRWGRTISVAGREFREIRGVP